MVGLALLVVVASAATLVSYEKGTEGMAGGYDMTPTDPLDVLRAQLVAIRGRLSELERPTGVQKKGIPDVRSASDSASNFTIPGDVSSVVLSLPVPVPDGYSKAVVMVNGMVRGQNFTAQTSYLHSSIRVNGVLGQPGGSGNRAVNGESTTAMVANTFVVEDLDAGDEIDINMYASVTSSGAPPTSAWSAALSNQASLNVTAIFLR